MSTGMAGGSEGCRFGQQVGMIDFFLPAQTLHWVQCFSTQNLECVSGSGFWAGQLSW